MSSNPSSNLSSSIPKLKNKHGFINNWIDPPKSSRPYVRWWWPGLDVSEQELISELEQLEKQGFGGAEIQAFLFGVPQSAKISRGDKIHRFAPNSFYYNILEKVLKKAFELKIKIDLTVGSAWPPGNTEVLYEDSMPTLLMGTKFVKGPIKFNGKIPKISVPPFYKYPKLMKNLMGPIFADFNINSFKPLVTLAVKVKKKIRKLHFITPRAQKLNISNIKILKIHNQNASNGDSNNFKSDNVITSKNNDKQDKEYYINWNVPNGKWQIFTIYYGSAGMSPMLDAKSSLGKISRVINHFDKERIFKYLETHLPEKWLALKEFGGNTLGSIFTDSQEIACEWFWTDDFFDEFKKRKKYDIKPYLPVCYVPNRDNQFLDVFFQNEKPLVDFEGDLGEKIRHDWLDVLSQLWAERYCKGVSEWGKKYGIKHRIQTYGVPFDLLLAYGAADIPETEQLYAGGLIDFLKLAGSAAHIYGKKFASSESMVWRFRDHMTTPLKWKVAMDRLFISGINHVIYHGYPYYPEWASYPGWDAWGNFSSNFNKDNPFLPYFHKINRYIARIQWIMRQGAYEAPIAVFYNLWNYDYKILKEEDLAGGFLQGFDAPAPGGPINWFMKKPRSPIDKKTKYLQEVADILIASGYNYSHINEERILSSTIDDNSIKIGFAKFKCIIFPNIDSISIEILYKIKEYVEKNIPVIFLEKLPNKQSGFYNWKENDRIIERTIKELINIGKITLTTKSSLINAIKSFKINPTLHISPKNPKFQYIHRILEKSDENDIECNIFFIRSGHSKNISSKIMINTNIIPGFKNIKDFLENEAIDNKKNNKIRNEVDNEQNYKIDGKIDFLVLDPWTGGISKIYPQVIDSYNGDLRALKIQFPFEFAPYQSLLILSIDSKNTDKFLQDYSSSIDKFPLYDKKYRKFPYHRYRSLPFARSQFESRNNLIKIYREKNLPSKIILKHWELTVFHRQKDGSIKKIIINSMRLVDWRKINELKYCIGPGNYRTSFELPNKYLEETNQKHIILEFDKIHSAAEIFINGSLVDVLLDPPFICDISEYIKPGTNVIEVKIIAALRNLLVGYGQKKKALMPAGIVGNAFIHFS